MAGVDMHTHKSWGNRSRLAVLSLAIALSGCGGASSDSGGSPGGTSSGTGILFQQTQESGISGHLFVPPATHTKPPPGVFELVLWQPNPTTPDGLLVPTSWDAGLQTGFTPSSPVSMQLGFQDKAGVSTAQMDGDTVGVYLNSADLPGSSTGQKMMITPQYLFAPGSEPMPFSSAGSVLSASMNLQIPTAVGSSTYVVADLMFVGPNGVRISYGAKIFSNGNADQVVGSAYDVDSNVYELNSPLSGVGQFLTQAPGSGSSTGTAWLGWRQFGWSISQPQFVAALNYLAVQYPGRVQSTDPATYVLAEVHLNAEFHFNPAPAELGWSMNGWNVSVTE